MSLDATGDDPRGQKALVRHNFTNHPPDAPTGALLDEVTSMCIAMGEWIVDNVPPSREQAVALTKLEECSMWMKAGIARNQ